MGAGAHGLDKVEAAYRRGDLFEKRQALMDLAKLRGWIAEKPAEARQLVMLKVER